MGVWGWWGAVVFVNVKWLYYEFAHGGICTVAGSSNVNQIITNLSKASEKDKSA